MLEPITNQELLNAIERAKKSAGVMPEKTSTHPKPQSANLVQAGLDNVDCPICGNTGTIPFKDENGCDWGRDCECMKRRVALRNIANSNMVDELKMYNFGNYETPNDETKRIKQKAMLFVNNDAKGFLIAGQSGAGKTHICSAMCGAFLEKEIETKYFKWRKDAPRLKAMVNDSKEYNEEINRLHNVPILYIDDFWKGNITDGDINLAFTIINDRYTRPHSKTIISTELTAAELVEVDEAVGGRILEMSKGFTIKAPNLNWRIE